MKNLCFAVGLLIPTLLLLDGRDGRTKLWTLDLSKLVHASVNSDASPEVVWSVSFSPDEERLAVWFGQHWSTPNPSAGTGHLVIVNMKHPETDVLSFDVSNRGHLFEPKIVWAPSGRLLALGRSRPLVVHLTGGSNCEYPVEVNFGGFLWDDSMILLRSGIPGAGERAEIVRPDCSVSDSQPSDFSVIRDTCARLNLLVVDKYGGGANVLQYPGMKTLQAWDADDGPTQSVHFADRCRVVCGGLYGTDSLNAGVACRSVQDGRILSQDLIHKLGDSALSAGGDLLAFTAYKYTDREGPVWDFLDMSGESSAPDRQVVWNVRTGKQLLSWVAMQQKFEVNSARQPKAVKPFAIALSSEGRYLAEGGLGRVTVYLLRFE